MGQVGEFMKLYLYLCACSALRSILRRDSHRPGLPVLSILYFLFVCGLEEIWVLKELSEGEFCIFGLSLFHSRVQEGKKDFCVMDNLVFLGTMDLCVRKL